MTGSLRNRRHKNHKRSKRTSKIINAVNARFRRNPCGRKKKLTEDIYVSPRTMTRAISHDLGLKSYRKIPKQYLTDKNKNRLNRYKELLLLYDKKL